MRKRRLPAIFIFLALNAAAFGQWTTNPPFVAWPATNHLRWTTNVGVYTNGPEWNQTNSMGISTNGYGGWTNNYLTADLWLGKNWYYLNYGDEKASVISPHYFYNAFDFLPKGYWTNFFLQAKDARILDIDHAMMERWLVLSTNNTISNYYARIDRLYDPGGNNKNDWFFRSEAFNLIRAKTFIKYVLPSFYRIEGTNINAFTEQLLCSNAAVPTNFLSMTGYTPSNAPQYWWRNASGSWTPYGKVITSQWTMVMATTRIETNSGTISTNMNPIWTNDTVDTYGGDTRLIGTNGQAFSKVITNQYLVVTNRAEDYGWDGVKACLTNLYITAKANTWGIGYGTNSAEAMSSNGPCVGDAFITPITIPGNADVENAIRLTNGWAAGPYGYAEPWAAVPWAWYWTLSSPVSLIQTGVPPSAVYSANWIYYVNCQLTYRNDNWEVGEDWSGSITTNRVMSHTNRWMNYNAPLRVLSSGPIARTLKFYATTNGTPVLWHTTNIIAGTHSVTSPPYIMDIPAIPPTFGTNVDPISSASGSHGYSPESGASYLYRYYSGSASTNVTFPAVSVDRTFEVWDFKYK